MISMNQKLSEPFIEKFAYTVVWGCIFTNQTLSEPFIEKYADKADWYKISEHQTLSESFIEKYSDKVIWDLIPQNQTLSEPFIEKFADKLNWSEISEHQKLSESFIEKYADKVDWYSISKYQKLSESFIEKYADKLNWERVSENQMLSEEFKQKHWAQLYPGLPNPHIEQNNVNVEKENNMTEYEKGLRERIASGEEIDWEGLSGSKDFNQLSNEFVKEFADELDWGSISEYQKLSESFIEKYADRVDWDWISAVQTLSEAFIEKYSDKVDWKTISRSQTFSYLFFNENKDKIDVVNLFLNPMTQKNHWISDTCKVHLGIMKEYSEVFQKLLLESNEYASKGKIFGFALNGFSGHCFSNLSTLAYLNMVQRIYNYETPIFLSSRDLNEFELYTGKKLTLNEGAVWRNVAGNDGSRMRVVNIGDTNFASLYPNIYSKYVDASPEYNKACSVFFEPIKKYVIENSNNNPSVSQRISLMDPTFGEIVPSLYDPKKFESFTDRYNYISNIDSLNESIIKKQLENIVQFGPLVKQYEKFVGINNVIDMPKVKTDEQSVSDIANTQIKPTR